MSRGSVAAGSQVRTVPPLFSTTCSVRVVLLPGWRTTMQRMGAGSSAARPKPLNFTWAWLVSVFETVAPPLLLGSLVLALLSALVGYLLVRAGWRLSTVRQWQKRKVARPC